MYKRLAATKIATALKDTPAIMVVGPRQCGKTTLVKQMVKSNWMYVTLDNTNQLEFAKADPIAFIQNCKARHVVIDEVQRAPELILSIKELIDEERIPGRFLLTGSANALALPKVADSLAGRVEIITLLPLATSEIKGTKGTFLTKILSGQIPELKHTRSRAQLIDSVIAGGFPEVLVRKEVNRRIAWFQQYVHSLIQKDLKDLAQIEHLAVMPRLIQVISNQVGNLINYTEVANTLGLSRQTVVRYLQLLDQLFLFQALPAWHVNANKRLSRTPKAHIVDSGLLCALKQLNHEKIDRDPQLFGHVLESYVLCELKRLATWCDEQVNFYHYRDKDKVEVDIVLETMAGDVIGIEVKAAATVRKQDFQGLERLKAAAGKRFRMGILLYDGNQTNRLGNDLIAAPIGCLWE